MKTIKSLLILVLLIGAAYQANAYYQYRKAAGAVPPTVKTVKVRAGNLRITLSGSGSLQPLETRVVSLGDVESQIVEIVEDGEMVKAGQIVCRLDTTELLNEHRERQVAYDDAQASLAKTKADVQLNLNSAATKAKKARQEQEMLLTTNEATTDQAQSQVEFNQSELAQAKRQYERQKSLAEDQLVPVREAELAELNRQGKQLSVVTASKQLEVQQHTEKIGVSKGEMLIEDAKFSLEAARNKAEQQVANAKFNVTRARQMLELARLRLQWCTVKAPISGLVVLEREYDPAMGTERPLRAGDEVDEEERIMDIIDTARMVVQADVGEIDIGQVRAGQSARVLPRSAPGVALRGKVKSVSEVAQAPPTWRTNNLPGKKVFRVTITVLDSRPELLRPGMTADLEIVQAEIEGGVRVPIQAVFQPSGVRGQGSGVSKSVSIRNPSSKTQHPSTGVVYVQREGRFWPKTVTLGRRNDVDVLITKGVQAGDVLAERVPPASLVGPATRKQQQAWAVRMLELLPWGVGR